MRAWRSVPRFEGRSSFFTWLYRIALNEATRHAGRRPAPRQLVSIEETTLDQASDGGETPDERTQRGELRVELERAIRALPMDYRAPLILRDVEGLSTAEAAEVMQLGQAAFKSRLHRARLAVRRAVDGYLDEDGHEA